MVGSSGLSHPDISSMKYLKLIVLLFCLRSYALAQTTPAVQLGYIDYYSAMVTPDKSFKKEWTVEGGHPNLAGYKVMEPLAEKAVRKRLSGISTIQSAHCKHEPALNQLLLILLQYFFCPNVYHNLIYLWAQNL